MRLVDEITERPVARALPAPTGQPAVTGPVPITAPALAIPEPTSARPFLPTLPTNAPKAAEPVTSPVAATAAALFFQTANVTPAAPLPRPKWRRRALVVLAAVVTVTMASAFAFRSGALVERFTGTGYDTNPLPLHPIPQPPFAGAEYTLTSQSIAMTNSLPTNYWQTERDQVNYTSKMEKSTLDRAKASVIGGVIGTPQSTSPPSAVIVDQQATYLPGAAPTDPWIRVLREPKILAPGLLSRNEIYMYQDVIDPTLRAQHPKSVVSETRHEIAVTTYTYTFPFGKFYESAPRLFEMVKEMDGNAAPDADVTVTISLDSQWMVRYLDVDVDVQSVLKYRAHDDPEARYWYRYTVDVVSITTTPVEIAAPTNTVDPTIESTTPPTVTP